MVNSEEYITENSHLFEDGILMGHVSDAVDGDYSGVFWFEHADGRKTRRYTENTAPKWLLALWEEIVR